MELLLVNGDLEAARRGDRLALERVLLRSRQNLRRYAEFHCVINAIEDAVQESLLLAQQLALNRAAVKALHRARPPAREYLSS